MSISKNNFIMGVIVILIMLAVIFGVSKINKNKVDYSIIYLSTGEVYIGKLTTFPNLRLKDGYILQVTKDATDPAKNNFQLQPIKDALWSPKVLNLIKDNVVFYGPLSPESRIAQTLADQAQ